MNRVANTEQVSMTSDHTYALWRSDKAESLFTFKFRVRGRGQFPTDMLRRDGCYPASTADAHAMVEPSTGGHDGYRTVTLISTNSRRNWEPIYGRWKSFGWSVTSSVTEDEG